MKKRILAGLATVALGGSAFLGFAGTSNAAGCPDNGPTNAPVRATLPDGGKVYASDPGSSGTVGVKGSHGYIEGSGSATGPSGAIQGNSSDTGVDGRIAGSGGAPTVCVKP